MASEDEDKYSLEDELGAFLAKDISPFVIYSKLSTFANDLRVPKREMDRITAPNAYEQDERVKEVLYFWQQKKTNYTVQKFVDDLKKWQKNGYLDREVLPFVESRIKQTQEKEAGPVAPAPSDRPERNEVLTDEMLLDLAMKFTTELPVHIFAEKGLGMDVNVVNSSLHNNRDINMAMHDVLQKWRVSQTNMKVAYTNLYHALLKVKMENLTEVLK